MTGEDSQGHMQGSASPPPQKQNKNKETTKTTNKKKGKITKSRKLTEITTIKFINGSKLMFFRGNPFTPISMNSAHVLDTTRRCQMPVGNSATH